jgi:hypothetical protein
VLILFFVSAICVVAGAVVFSERVATLVRATAGRIPVPLLHRVTAALVDAVRSYATHHAAVTRVLLLSILVQILQGHSSVGVSVTRSD